jgi:hypothetical protein
VVAEVLNGSFDMYRMFEIGKEVTKLVGLKSFEETKTLIAGLEMLEVER